MSDSEQGEDAGNEPPGAVVTFSVPEMDCPSCAGKVDSSLGRVDGVQEADLRPTAGTARVTYDPDRIGETDLIAAIEGAGYEVTNGSESGDGTDGEGGIAPPSSVWTGDRAIWTWIGAAFLVGGLVVEFLAGANPTVVVTPLFELSAADVAFLVAVLTSGVPVVRGGYYSARNLSLDIDLLMGTAILAATAIGLFVEAATLAVLFSIAELLEQYAMDRTRDSLRELMELAPNEATVVRNGEEVTVPVEEVGIGETVAVRPGEKIPVDGIVRTGTSAVDQSPITGESTPVDKADGDEVYAGTLNEAGYLEVEATTTDEGSTLSRIIDLVREAQAEKTDKERFVDRFAGYYTPSVVVLAILTAAVPPLLIDGSVAVGFAGYSHTFAGDWLTWFVRGLTLLVIACPCAFVISTPVSVTSGVTAAARNGVLIKGGNHLEAMGEVDAIAFDKTGTLTKGELGVTDVVPVGDVAEKDVLRYAGALERRSEHPIADAVRERVEERGIEFSEVSDFESITGKGVRGTIEGTTYYAGNPGLFEELGFELGESGGGTRADGGVAASVPEGTADSAATIDAMQRDGKTVVLVGTADCLLGIVGIADEIRPAAERAIENLHRLGVTPLVMLTGDNEGTARAVAGELGIDEYRAGLLPDEKVAAIEELEAEHGDVAMVGDGVNDAPALATASVGVAMGAAGTDTAIETADIALMGDDIEKLPYLYALSHKANSVIRQNIWSSLGVKLLLAVGVPFGYVSVAAAVVVGDMGMSLGVTGNAMRLSRMDPERFLERDL
ncbi:cation-translocating P-type ATPase [Natronomonas sp. F2-12]|jgi:Cd2+/Zn2+-exporting ATPase|uniref:Cation-translocating P-type ATPase n=1 Tax=Natronomonas aquatica TaxID=2841590 RepID=A0A9R1CUK2_9EURY|nr:cation-translocating P-type ATPase [Natronomonas aquatica]MCQ4333891.1 cation-translocating P-type ATPase [Natronomonas aquatica]